MTKPLQPGARAAPDVGPIPGEFEMAYHYQVISRAIDAMDNSRKPVTLAEMAGEAGMSPAHFQRVFSRWAGVSPTRLNQYLLLGDARVRLRQGQDTQTVANDLNLSGSGRLHDMFVTWEAMTPGQYARGGEGLIISWGWFDSPFGPALFMGTDRGICGIGFGAHADDETSLADMAGRWPKADFRHAPSALYEWAKAAFSNPGAAKIPLLLIGAPFQIKVWEALISIPPGQTSTYSAIAGHVCRPGAARAVGTAVGRNPVSWLVPCHRVLRRCGGLGGYYWGLPRKRAMLAWEALHAIKTPADGQSESVTG